MKKQICRLLILIGAGVLAGGCGPDATYTFGEERSLTVSSISAEPLSLSEEPDTPGTGQAAPEETVPTSVWIYVCGAVNEPGVYELPQGSRVYEAIALAGGLTEEADTRALNQAALLTDGEQITVLTEEETAGAVLPESPSGAQSTRINLNTATREELMTLTGIGEARAAAILAYRETHGPFRAIEEIMNVEGIKEKGFEKIKEDIEV